MNSASAVFSLSSENFLVSDQAGTFGHAAKDGSPELVRPLLTDGYRPGTPLGLITAVLITFLKVEAISHK